MWARLWVGMVSVGDEKSEEGTNMRRRGRNVNEREDVEM